MIKKYLLVALMLGLLVSPAFGHNVLMMSNFEGDKITGESYFSTGDAVANAKVTVESEGSLIAEGKTDEEGIFSIAVPLDLTSAKITVNAGMGHVAHEEISREAAPEGESKEKVSSVAMSSGLSSQEIRNAVASEVAPLKQMIVDLHKAQTKPDMPRILGGIGYIIGIVGAFMWGKSRRG